MPTYKSENSGRWSSCLKILEDPAASRPSSCPVTISINTSWQRYNYWMAGRPHYIRRNSKKWKYCAQHEWLNESLTHWISSKFKKLSNITKKYRIPNTCQVDIIVVSTALAWRVENFNVQLKLKKNFTNGINKIFQGSNLKLVSSNYKTDLSEHSSRVCS